MKRNKGQPIPESIRVKLSGEQEWRDVLQILENDKWMWTSGDNPLKNADIYSGKRLGIMTEAAKKITAPSQDSTMEGAISASEFIKQYGGTIEYEIGDWVVIVRAQGGDPKGTVTKVVSINDKYSLKVKNMTSSITATWEALTDAIRPATKEEIESVCPPVKEQTESSVISERHKYKVGQWIVIHNTGCRVGKGYNGEGIDITRAYKIKEIGWHNSNNQSYRMEGTGPEVDGIVLKGNTDIYIRLATEAEIQAAKQPLPTPWSIVTTDGVTVYEKHPCYWYHMAHKSLGWNGAPQKVVSAHESSIGKDWLLFSTYEAAEKWRQQQNKKPLSFTTEEGYAIYEGDKVVWVFYSEERNEWYVDKECQYTICENHKQIIDKGRTKVFHS